VYVRDLRTGKVRRVSVGSREQQGKAGSDEPSISAGGRFVVFTSQAWNFAGRDEKDRFGGRDVFLRDRRSGVTRWVSRALDGGQADSQSSHPSMSSDGGEVAFSSLASDLVGGDTNAGDDVFMWRAGRGGLQRVSVTDQEEEIDAFSSSPAVSADGHHVAFMSEGSGIAPGADPEGIDVFVRDAAFDPAAQRPRLR